MSTLNNLAITTTNRLMTTAIGRAFDTLQSIIANGGRDSNCKFYHNNGAGGSVLQVVAKSVVGGAVSDIKDVAVNHFNSWLNGKDEPKQIGTAWVEAGVKRKEAEEKVYGKMLVNDGKETVYALDDWGCICPDSLMLGIKVDKPVKITQSFPNYKAGALADGTGNGNSTDVTGQSNSSNSVLNNIPSSDTLVWYDTTALVTINSDKNIIATRVTGRDYSRKELVSNGDIKFSVSGQITSGRPDVYPAEEVKKFIRVMQYKGIVKINNQMLDQFGISHIVITDFSLSPREGYKAMQSYSFSAIGLQPEKELEIAEDTITIIPQAAMVDTTDDNAWLSMLKNQLDGLKSMAGDLFSQGMGIATGMLDGLL